MITLQDIQKAHKRVQEVVLNTPYTHAPKLSKRVDADIFLKKENLQHTGAFKLRGAFNKISSLTKAQKEQGVVAASAGNHAQGVAYSAKHFSINATIVMPEATPLTKVSGVKAYGAKVVLNGSNYDEAYAKAVELAKEENAIFIHPFADDEIIAGQGSVALEILEEGSVDYVVVPIGGGGLISGMAKAIKEIDPNIKVIGVSASGAPALKMSFEQKKPIDTTTVKTIADGIAVRDTSSFTLEYLLELVDDVVEVNDEEIATAILFLIEEQKLVVEGAGAVSVAAILHNKIANIKGKKVALVLSGGNIDVTMLSVIIEKGLLKSSRKMKFIVTLVDKPGSLKKLTEILSSVDTNIVHIDYDRTSIDLEYGEANVSLSVETKGAKHQQMIKDELYKFGYKIKEFF